MAPAKAPPPIRSPMIGKTRSTALKAEYQRSNSFLVFGSIYITKASGAITTKMIAAARRAPRITNTNRQETIILIRPRMSGKIKTCNHSSAVAIAAVAPPIPTAPEMIVAPTAVPLPTGSLPASIIVLPANELNRFSTL